MSATVTTFLVSSTIINYEKSPSSSHRIRLYFANNKRMDIGSRSCSYYYIDANKVYRDKYFSDLTTEELTKIYNCIPSRILFECLILNGRHSNIIDNINDYNSSIQRLRNN
jgi:hypothetical protein